MKKAAGVFGILLGICIALLQFGVLREIPGVQTLLCSTNGGAAAMQTWFGGGLLVRVSTIVCCVCLVIAGFSELIGRGSSRFALYIFGPALIAMFLAPWIPVLLDLTFTVNGEEWGLFMENESTSRSFCIALYSAIIAVCFAAEVLLAGTGRSMGSVIPLAILLAVVTTPLTYLLLLIILSIFRLAVTLAAIPVGLFFYAIYCLFHR